MRLISIPEACKRLGIGHWSIYQQINKNALKTVKIGKRRLVSVRALNDFITALEQ
jgi:excisionase family DNA binding protein